MLGLFGRAGGRRTDRDRRVKIVPQTKRVHHGNPFVAFAVVQGKFEGGAGQNVIVKTIAFVVDVLHRQEKGGLPASSTTVFGVVGGFVFVNGELCTETDRGEGVEAVRRGRAEDAAEKEQEGGAHWYGR